MLRKLLYKMFGLTADSCLTCEVLRDQLEKSEGERRNLIARLLDQGKPEQVVQETEKFEPIKPQFIPWRVRQQMLEQEDRKTAALMKQSKTDIESLEKELNITHSPDSVAAALAELKS